MLHAAFHSLAAWAARFVRRSKRIVVAVSVALCAAILVLGWLSYRSVKEVVTEDFNNQQLVLAKYAARQIEHSLALLLQGAAPAGAGSPALQYRERVALTGRLQSTFFSIADSGGDSAPLRSPPPATQAHLYVRPGLPPARTDAEDPLYLVWASDRGEPGSARSPRRLPPSHASSTSRTPRRRLARRSGRTPPTRPTRHPTRGFTGVLTLVVDVAELTGSVTRDIRSGKTGYAWVIDANGTFLHHQEASFIGKNAFEARTAKMPTISFSPASTRSRRR